MRCRVETTGSRWHAATPHRRVGARRGARDARRGRWAIVALLTVVGLVAAPHRAHAAIFDGAIVWGSAYRIDPAYIERVIDCESGGDPAAYNAASGSSGLLQFEPQTWVWLVGLLNQDTQLAPGLSAYDPEWRPMGDPDAQIHVFAWAVAHGYASQWVCS